jgi:beta-N-acetylhexosaminidase
LTLAAAVAVFAACSSAGPVAAKKKLTESEWVRRTLAHMTLQEKVGQLFVINAYGDSVRDSNPQMVAFNKQYYGVSTIRQLIKKYHPGGIIYFGWTNNLQSPAQIVELSNGIQRVALAQRTPVPLLISTDQEQGEVLRIGPPATVFPGNMALAAARDVSLARRAALITGQELRAMGINVDEAPVVDVNVNPLNEADGIRSYGDRPDFVTGYAVAQVGGYQTKQGTTGVAATAKHFPGLGATTINSDNGKSISEQTLAEVRKQNFPPFRAAIKAGLDRVMAGHIVFPKIKQGPGTSSLDPFYINGLLRTELHFDGVVTTDALNAGALAGLSPQRVAIGALRAGDDMLLEIGQTGVDTGKADLVTAYPAVLRAVRSGVISRRRLDRSVTRILRLKWRLGLVKNAISNPERVPNVVGIPPHLAVADEAATRSITLIKNDAGLLPLRAGTGEKVLVTGFGQTTTATIGADIAAHGLTTQVIDTGFNPNAVAIANAIEAAQQSDLVVVSTFNAWSGPGQIQLVNALLGAGKPLVVAAVGTPYDIAYFPAVTTFITSYDFQPVSLHPLVRALFGEIDPSGKLPVTITAPPPSTQVLYPFGYGIGLR